MWRSSSSASLDAERVHNTRGEQCTLQEYLLPRLIKFSQPALIRIFKKYVRIKRADFPWVH